MRLWSLHPQYLDRKGLLALWREGLLAQAVLSGRTRGYRHHPQLTRFRQTDHPTACIAAYLREVQLEAAKRGYEFDASKIGPRAGFARLPVTKGQLDYEWQHLAGKLAKRDPGWLHELPQRKRIAPHPLFKVVAGGIADWEKRHPASSAAR